MSTGRQRRRTGLVLAALAAVVVAGLVASAVVSGDSADQPEVALAPTTSAPPAFDAAPIVVVPSGLADDRVRIEAQGAVAPWIGVEVCASAPPGCIPVWTYSLAQEGEQTVAEVRPPRGFVAPDGVDHDCDRERCELRVSTEDATETWPLGASSEVEPESAGSRPEPGLELTVSPDRVRDGAPTTITVAGAPAAEQLIVSLCAVRDRDRGCPIVHTDRTDEDGSATFTLRLPRQVSGVAATAAGSVRTSTDCALQSCRLRVVADDRRVEQRIVIEPSEAPPARAKLDLDAPGPYAPHQTVVLRGTDFDVVSSTHRAQARWVMCGQRPVALHEVGEICGTPRTLRTGATIAPDGTFTIPVTFPAPDAVRTWHGAEPIGCRDQCWLAVLAEPFGRPVSLAVELDLTTER